MKDTIKLNQLLTDISNLEDFIKISAIDYHINDQCAREILRLLKEATNRVLR